MTRIELFKSIVKAVHETSNYEEMIKNHHEFAELRVMSHPDDEHRYQAFTPNNIHKIADVNLVETIQMLDEFERFMTELSQTMDGINYNPGSLYGTVKIGGDLQMVIRAGFACVRHRYDGGHGYTIKLEPRIGLQFTTSPVEEFSGELDTLINKTGETSTAFQKHFIRDHVKCEIPEHRWYHLPGSKDLITYIDFDDPFDGWRGDTLKDGCTSAEIHLIRDEIIRMRTIVKIMDIAEYKI